MENPADFSTGAYDSLFHFFDVLGLVIIVLMTFMWLAQFLKDRKMLSELDPLKPYNPDEKK